MVAFDWTLSLAAWFAAVQEPPAAPPAAPPEAPPAAPAAAPQEPPAPIEATWGSALFDDVAWRPLGPINMGGRITDLAVDPRRKSTWYIAAASGGLWKTVNAGTTFEPLFEGGPTASIGDVTIAPSDSSIVWLGTGEANPRNSVIPGAGVFQSTDGGKSFAFMGLADSRAIGRIAIHPTDPNVLFVAAMGHTWGDNDERGLYRTRDGGATWERVLFVDAATGCIDVAIDPLDPSIVHAATWQRRRDEFDGGDPIVQFGPGGALWRSIDGGTTFTRSSAGLPTVQLGRVGFDLFAADPQILYATVQTELTGKVAPGQAPGESGPAWLGVRGEASADGYVLSEAIEGGPAAAAGLLKGDVLQKIGDAEIRTFEELRIALDARNAGDEAAIVVRREGNLQTLQVKFGRRPGTTGDFGGEQGGQTANAQERQGSGGFETGGIFRSDDRGATWRRVNSLNPRPFYYSQIRVDPRDAAKVWVLGISVHVSRDGGATFDSQGAADAHPDHHAMWIDPSDGDHVLLGNDGGLYETFDDGKHWEMNEKLPIGQFYNVAVGMDRPYSVAGGLQDNGSWVGPSATRRRQGIPSDAWIYVNGGDGFQCAIDPEDASLVYAESQNGVLARFDRDSGARADIRPPGKRFCWNTPFLLSPWNSRTLWCAGERLFKSVNRGDDWVAVSPELSRTPQGSATAVDESPRVADVVAVGTDDGALWLTRDGGRTWESLVERLPGVPGPRYVAELLFSRHDAETLFVVLDGRRSDDCEPWLFRSRDFGRTFTRIGAGLPAQNLHALAESPRRRGILFAGSSVGCHYSIDDGDTFVAFDGRLPTVPVFDLVVHPRERELVAATHGRGIWIADIAPLEQLSKDVVAAELELLTPRTVTLAPRLPGSNSYAAPRFHGENPRDGVEFWWWRKSGSDANVALQVKNVAGGTIARLTGSGAPGLQVVRWNLALDVDAPGVPSMRDRRLKPGEYLVVIEADGKSDSATLRVEEEAAAGGGALIGGQDVR
ncbi:MAG: PDZ domain-containing protein [Planctomycetes bacterium]|nr:PDZ domain-containing protein [Planctomycetota bacterium]